MQTTGFQFLIGRLATHGIRKLSGLRSTVSIPHRQARNQFVQPALPLDVESFNSSQVGSQLHRYGLSLKIEKAFQFLIGRLATYCYTLWFLILRKVSIPHRQARNSPLLQNYFQSNLRFNSSQVGSQQNFLYQFYLCPLCFNSSQVGSQLSTLTPSCLAKRSFNSSQVGSQPGTKVQVQKILYRFNSSQVGSQLYRFFRFFIVDSLFQFLIGRLATHRYGLPLKIEKAFQFLIGRLATLSLLCQLYFPEQVSIPHRQARNVYWNIDGGFVQVFQFLIGRLATYFYIIKSSIQTCQRADKFL